MTEPRERLRERLLKQAEVYDRLAVAEAAEHEGHADHCCGDDPGWYSRNHAALLREAAEALAARPAQAPADTREAAPSPRAESIIESTHQVLDRLFSGLEAGTPLVERVERLVGPLVVKCPRCSGEGCSPQAVAGGGCRGERAEGSEPAAQEARTERPQASEEAPSVSFMAVEWASENDGGWGVHCQHRYPDGNASGGTVERCADEATARRRAAEMQAEWDQKAKPTAQPDWLRLADDIADALATANPWLLRDMAHATIAGVLAAEETQRKIRRILQGEAERPAAEEGLREALIQAYWKAQDNWSAQCFCFTSAPEQMRCDAHQTARDGFNELVNLLGPIVRPWLNEEYWAAYRASKARGEVEPPPAPPTGKD